MRLLALEPTSVVKGGHAQKAPSLSVRLQWGLPCPAGLLSASLAGLKVKGCTLPLFSAKESSERDAWREHLLSNKNKSCAESSQGSSSSQNSHPFTYLFTFSRNHGVCKTVNQTEEKYAECVSG